MLRLRLSPAGSRAFSVSARTLGDGVLPPIFYTYVPYHVPYRLGLALQEALVERRRLARQVLASVHPESEEARQAARVAGTDHLLLLEHRPVYTVGRREKEDDSGNEAERLTSLGADYHLTKRGGQITYHGPGQVTGYPILDIGAMKLGIRDYICRLQTFMTAYLGSLSVPTVPSEHTGVWTSPTAKIGSIGVQVRHRVTSHGFAINITRDVDEYFRRIVACGIQGATQSSVEQEMLAQGRRGKVRPVQDHIPALVHHFGTTFGRQMLPDFKIGFTSSADGVTLASASVDGVIIDQDSVSSE